MKKVLAGVLKIGFFLTITSGICFGKSLIEKPKHRSENNSSSIKIVSVDEVVKAPGEYKDFLGVEGDVIRIDKSNSVFLLGCEDACIVMPVKYKGKMPKVKSKVIVYGEVKKQENGKYIFQAKEIKIK